MSALPFYNEGSYFVYRYDATGEFLATRLEWDPEVKAFRGQNGMVLSPHECYYMESCPSIFTSQDESAQPYLDYLKERSGEFHHP